MPIRRLLSIPVWLVAALFGAAFITTAAPAPAINPLTGLVVADASVLDRRPIVAKISNSPADVRPQSGISSADIVFEHYTEVGITRFSAIFYSQTPRRVGSIRSARLIDYELVPMYDALLVFAGASLGVDKRIYGNEYVFNTVCMDREDQAACRAEVAALGPAGEIAPSDVAERAYKGSTYGAPLYVRDESIPQPHNLFADLAAVWERATLEGVNAAPSLEGLVFDSTPPPDGSSGIYGQIRYLTTFVEWTYDAATNRYYRSTDGVTHWDDAPLRQISADNVIILYAGHYLTDIVESGGGENVHWSEQITLWPQGDATLLRDGKAYNIRWQRPTRDAMLTWWTTDGQLMPLKPGNTWVQVVRLPAQMDTANEWVIVE